MKIKSRHDQNLKDLLRREFEYQLERTISSERDFRKACRDYAELEEHKEHPVRLDSRMKRCSCYLCYYPASNPVLIDVDEDGAFEQNAFHRDCMRKAALNYFLEGKFKSIPTLWKRDEIAKLIKFPRD